MSYAMREFALQLAVDSRQMNQSPSQVVEAARQYLAFLSGEEEMKIRMEDVQKAAVAEEARRRAKAKQRP